MEKQKKIGISFLAGNWPLDNDKKTVIFIHGSGLSKNLWINQVSGLCEVVNPIAIDLPGHGDSNGESTNNINEYSKIIEDFMKELNIEKPLLCGLSMGGAVVLHMVLNSKIDYSGSVLLNTGAKLKVLPEIMDTIKNDYEKYVELSKISLVSKNSGEESIKPLVKDIENCSPEAAYRDFELCNNFDVMDQLGKIDIPVLVITSGDDNMTPEKYGAFLNEHINNSRRVHIDGAGHMAPLEKPGDVNKAIIEFIKNLSKNNQ